ncbi:hypothetical protein STK_17260 [Sulfurisphaera tokodaii str. 7]|uniref:Uncharacterized protein n=2 Tax=Sulfurisphaera tokodaii TaxID=111955 RepID=Q96ZW0_SULTO|nr:hypothetical protein STK_17260 [Sulfurisphaera tokodaii str. 7]HII73341.1 hypothetical protein [Sulfurisphaera tokodaii]
MKWALLLFLTLLVLPIVSLAFYRYGGGGGFSYFKYSQTVIVQPSSTQTVKENGSTLSTASWLNPSYVGVYNKYYLQVLPNEEYITNNVSLTLSIASITLNVIFPLMISSNSEIKAISLIG